MKLVSIELQNFRPYEGRQKIEFAAGPERNVTVIYGTNGGGKTTLLNAFTWGLYGFLSEDVEFRDQLINSTVWHNSSEGSLVAASVAIEFEHQGTTFTVRRTVEAHKRGAMQPQPRPELVMLKRNPDGSTVNVANPSGNINRILPERLSRFFFVNGERIEGLAKQEAYAEIQDAIKTLLGLEVVERAVTHLPKVSQRLRKLIKADGEAQEKVSQITREVDEIDKEVEEKKARERELFREIQLIGDEVKALNLRLTQLSGAKELQHKRYRIEHRQGIVKESLQSEERARAESLAKHGFLSFISGLPAKISDICERLRQRGELPAPLKATFIEDLLAEGTCICGTHLREGSPERERLEAWRSRAGLAEVEAAWNSLKGAIDTVGDQREQFLDGLMRVDEKIAELEEESRQLVADLSQVSNDLKNAPTEDVAETEARREELIRSQNERNRALGDVTARLEALASSRAEKEDLVRRLEIKDEASQRTLRRMDAVQEAEGALSEILALLSDGVRNRLDTRLQQLFGEVALKNQTPELTPGFQLELWANIHGQRVPATKSTGENMLLSLAFVGALAGEARIAGAGGAFFEGVGGDFPVVMDAVFGNLDEDYRRAVAKFLPELTPQVIVLTSKAQAGSVVEQELKPRIGKQYVIATHTTKAGLGQATEELILNGQAYPYQVIGSDRDGAKLMEVEA
ncbi:AAA family ATPase [Microtetraspora malaysiensis]|uniref:AAA family ATPase n=1 Tax=Microtetraspora malaysiensis TaxID=161358 RepID=UPI003D8CA75A